MLLKIHSYLSLPQNPSIRQKFIKRAEKRHDHNAEKREEEREKTNNHAQQIDFDEPEEVLEWSLCAISAEDAVATRIRSRLS